MTQLPPEVVLLPDGSQVLPQLLIAMVYIQGERGLDPELQFPVVRLTGSREGLVKEVVRQLQALLDAAGEQDSPTDSFTL